MLSNLKTAIAELIIHDQVLIVVITAICCEFKSSMGKWIHSGKLLGLAVWHV